MKTDELREKYLDFFVEKGCVKKPSDVLVPTWDSSVLFTPAGMNQFKPHFLGKVKLEFTRATTCQKCLRTGDIDNVGRTAFHHTFFEMLGNFSFGDYFKKEAIAWAWEFLTDKKWLGLDPQRLKVTVYKDDDEAANIWHKDIGLEQKRIARLDEDENFWPASAPSEGPDGVCGPCSEIYYILDDGSDVEIWNLVFTQFNRVGNPPDNLRPLPSKNIDTGMGLERTASVLQGVTTNYHIDTLKPIVLAAAEVCGVKYDPNSDNGRRLRRITDHVRAATMAVHENVYPGPNKEKYVIRRLLRRAVLDGHQMGLRDPFLHQLVPAVVDMMKQPYPELTETVKRVSGVIELEEKNFFGTLEGGLARVEKAFNELIEAGRHVIPGDVARALYSTYGIPPELIESLGQEHDLVFDWPGFQEPEEEEEAKAGAGELFKSGAIESLKRSVNQTEFTGYTEVETKAEIKGIVAGKDLYDELSENPMEDNGKLETMYVVLDKTPFYARSGGQVGDIGEIVGEDFRFEVLDTTKNDDLYVHEGHLREGTIQTGATAVALVNAERRDAIRRAHSATHILHHALQDTLGQHAQQQGSEVKDDWLRFDFTNMHPVSSEEISTIEKIVNDCVSAADAIDWKIVPLEEAKKAGAMMLFGEKYPDPVRMVSMGSFSKELCGGTHLTNTKEVGQFEIISEEGVSAGTRRIVAYTGERASEFRSQVRATLQEAADKLNVQLNAVPEATKALAQQVRALKKQLTSGAKNTDAPTVTIPRPVKGSLSYEEIRKSLTETARMLNIGLFDVPARIDSMHAEIKSLSEQLDKLAESGDITADSLLENALDIGKAKVIIAELPGANPNLMRQLIDQVRQKDVPAAILFAAAQGDDKVLLVAGLSRDLVSSGGSAGNWLRDVAQVVGGGGGGRPDLAQAGGKDPSKLPEALEKAKEVAEEMFG